MFQQLMDNVTAKLSGVFVHLDDILVALMSAAQHESDLRELFSTLRNFGLVLNTSKCVFGVFFSWNSWATTSLSRESNPSPKRSKQ